MTDVTCKTRTYSLRKKKNAKKNKTCRPTHVCKKSQFIKEILYQWKKQTHGGCFEKDKTTQYINDYYLSLKKHCDYNNHVHLILHNYEVKHNNKNTIFYLMKKYNNKTGVISHSAVVEISILSNPAKIVQRMIKLFAKYNKS